MKKLFTVRFAIVTSLTLLPLTVSAQTSGQVSSGISSFAGLIDTVTNSVVKSMATLLLSLALLAFFYGLVEYIWAKRQGNGDKVKAGNEFMTWGLVALFVMFSVYGIIKFAQNTLFGSGNLTEITIPNINFKAGSNSGTPGNSGIPGTGNTNSPGTSGNTGVFGNTNTIPDTTGLLREGAACSYNGDCSGTLVCTGGYCVPNSNASGATNCSELSKTACDNSVTGCIWSGTVVNGSCIQALSD